MGYELIPWLSDYPRTLREWGRRLEANLTQDMVVKDYPGLRNPSDYAAFKRKWQYLFAYAGAGFSKGYITCHMLTFIREVSIKNPKSKYYRCSNLFIYSERYADIKMRLDDDFDIQKHPFASKPKWERQIP